MRKHFTDIKSPQIFIPFYALSNNNSQKYSGKFWNALTESQKREDEYGF